MLKGHPGACSVLFEVGLIYVQGLRIVFIHARFVVAKEDMYCSLNLWPLDDGIALLAGLQVFKLVEARPILVEVEHRSIGVLNIIRRVNHFSVLVSWLIVVKIRRVDPNLICVGHIERRRLSTSIVFKEGAIGDENREVVGCEGLWIPLTPAVALEREMAVGQIDRRCGVIDSRTAEIIFAKRTNSLAIDRHCASRTFLQYHISFVH